MLKVIFYHRDNCQPCRSAEPGWEELRQAYAGRVVFQKVEVGIGNAADYGIQGTPSFALENGGQRINLVTGGDFAQLRALIKDALQMIDPKVDPKPATTSFNIILIGIGILVSIFLLSKQNGSENE